MEKRRKLVKYTILIEAGLYSYTYSLFYIHVHLLLFFIIVNLTKLCDYQTF